MWRLQTAKLCVTKQSQMHDTLRKVPMGTWTNEIFLIVWTQSIGWVNQTFNDPHCIRTKIGYSIWFGKKLFHQMFNVRLLSVIPASIVCICTISTINNQAVQTLSSDIYVDIVNCMQWIIILYWRSVQSLCTVLHYLALDPRFRLKSANKQCHQT